MTRRSSSNIPGPHRGQEFSVDDDVHEIEGDFVSKQTTTAGSTSGFGSVRHPPSSIRRRSTQAPNLSRVESAHEEDDPTDNIVGVGRGDGGDEDSVAINNEDETGDILDSISGDENQDDDDDEDGDISDAESFTLKDRQEAINETHPFGIRIWKPALYKKDRSVQKTAEGDIHSSPGGRVSKWLLFFNVLWTLCFGWWLALAALSGAVVCFVFAAAPSAVEYGRVLYGLCGYIFYPFGKFVRLEQDEAYAHEDEGEGRSITEYEQWQSGDLEDGRLFFGPQAADRSIVGRRRGSIDSMATETDSLLGRARRGIHRDSSVPRMKRRLFGRGQWNIGRVIFFLFFYGLITPLLFIVSGICWFMVFWIPMGKVTLLLFYHLRRHPLALSFQSDTAYSRSAALPNSSILLCTYRAAGLKYWKYTVDGTNIFLINLMGVVLFVIFDYWVLLEMMELELTITHPAFLFVAALFSIIPLAYFIGQAVASISAQSSMGLGAAINAFFSTLVEVFLYCVALNQGKGQLVEGSIIGSIFAGILFLPGLSMCFGAIKRKTQRFNAKSAGVTSTMLLFAVIAAFGPTLFYQIYGTVS
jgi:Ca2+:H+ antiporter